MEKRAIQATQGTNSSGLWPADIAKMIGMVYRKIPLAELG
jgi:hypothetical protein